MARKKPARDWLLNWLEEQGLREDAEGLAADAVRLGINSLRAELRSHTPVIEERSRRDQQPQLQSPFTLFGIREDTPEDEARRVFRQHASRLHPDHGGKRLEWDNMIGLWNWICDLKGWH
jgi:hypothetical protein